MIKYAKQGDVYLRAIEKPEKKVKQILWGDFLNVVETADRFFKVQWKDEQYWVLQEECQDTRPLEIVFVDVGQGDGCLLVAGQFGPEEKIVVIDAGLRRNMFNFAKWRFGAFKKPFRFHAAVVTHSDEDHYGGFLPFFEHSNVSFDRVHHNGIAERDEGPLFGPSDTTKRFLTGIVATDAEMRALYDDPIVRGGKRYPKLMHTALNSGRVGAVEMLSTAHGTAEDGRSWMPGFSPTESPNLTIEVLGPVVEPDGNGRPRLRWFGDAPGARGQDPGKTKNGHSVLLRLRHFDFTLLFGGDLNLPAEDFLLRHYGELSPHQPLSDAVTTAQSRLSADVMKSCHHGSADVTDEFLDAVSPFAFTVSSGDQESHAHPRPDLLGRLGRHGRGEAPLILCTEILRSGREKEDEEILRKIRRLDGLIEKADTPADKREQHRKDRAAAQDVLARRNVEIYGAITLRTDGEHLVVAFRLEKDRPGRTSTQRWQTFRFRHHPGEGFLPVP